MLFTISLWKITKFNAISLIHLKRSLFLELWSVVQGNTETPSSFPLPWVSQGWWFPLWDERCGRLELLALLMPHTFSWHFIWSRGRKLAKISFSVISWQMVQPARALTLRRAVIGFYSPAMSSHRFQFLIADWLMSHVLTGQSITASLCIPSLAAFLFLDGCTFAKLVSF